jgi:hypothetical protein
MTIDTTPLGMPCSGLREGFARHEREPADEQIAG